MSTLPEPRPLSLERDAAALVGLAGRLRAAGGSAYLHPGGLQWWLRKTVDRALAAYVSYEGPELVAFTVEDGDYVTPHADPGRVDLRDLIAWHEARLGEIEMSVWDHDAPLREWLGARGYTPSGHLGPELVWRVNGEPPRAELPPGYRFVRFEASLDDAYVALHRAAWSTERPSDYQRARHDAVTAMPQFDRAMVPIVAAPDGTLAAFCIGWFDPVTRWTEIEPLGTHPDHTRRGLGHAVVREVIHRSWERGAVAVMVWATDPASTTHVNEPARRLYVSSGMRPERVLREYRKTR